MAFIILGKLSYAKAGTVINTVAIKEKGGTSLAHAE
jgi:hypothetical protein